MDKQGVKIEKIKPGALNKADWFAIADLIYGTDNDIFSDAFGCKEIAREIVPVWINKPNTVFSAENIRVARMQNGEIVGLILFSHNKAFSLDISKEEREKLLPESFKLVEELYFGGLSDGYASKQDRVYGFCICVKKRNRRGKIGAMLLHQFVEEHRYKNDIYVDIVASNKSCNDLCTDVKYGFGFKIIDLFLDYEKGGTMTLPVHTLYRSKDNPERDGYIISTPKKDGFRMPGEFQPHEGCWMLWPERTDNWRNGAKPAQTSVAKVAEAISRFEPVTVGVSASQYENAVTSLPSCVRIIEMSSNDAWSRDTGPTFVRNDSGIVRGIDWKFNAYGGLVNGSYFPWHHDNRIAYKICEIEKKDIYTTSGFVLEGGAIHSDGDGTLYTTEECLLNEGRNPHMTKEEIEEILKEYTGADKVIWLKRGLYMDVTNGHVDNILSIVKPGIVMLAWTDDESDPQYEISLENYKILEQTTDAKGRKLEIIKLILPEPTYITNDEVRGVDVVEGVLPKTKGHRLSASYINFYIANGGIIFPLFNDPNDKVAEETLRKAFPDREVVGVESREILLGGGNIHCITQQLPK
jgi:agmatine deiminase